MRWCGVCTCVYGGVYVYVSVWCFCPSGLQIIVNVPTGSFHRRSSGQCQCQVTETRRINQDWGLKRGRCTRLCHQSERHLMGNAHKCAMLPVWSTYSPWQRQAVAAAFKMEAPFWMPSLHCRLQWFWWTSRQIVNWWTVHFSQFIPKFYSCRCIFCITAWSNFLSSCTKLSTNLECTTYYNLCSKTPSVLYKKSGSL